MALIDLTTYVETDPAGDLTVSSTQIDIATMDRYYAASVRGDYGAAYFAGDFEHRFNFYRDSSSTGASYFVPWALTLLGYGSAHDSPDVQMMRYYSGSGFTLFEGISSSYISDSMGAVSSDTLYYGVAIRDESVGTYGQLDVSIYSDSALTMLVDTLTLTLRAKVDYRYHYAVSSRNGQSAGQTFTGYVNGHDIDPGATPSIEATPEIATAAWSALAPATKKTAAVAPAAATWTAVAPTTSKSNSVEPAVAGWTVLAPTVNKTAVVAPLVVTWSAPAPALTKRAAVPPVPATWSALAPTVAKAASVAPIVVEWSGLAPTASLAEPNIGHICARVEVFARIRCQALVAPRLATRIECYPPIGGQVLLNECEVNP